MDCFAALAMAGLHVRPDGGVVAWPHSFGGSPRVTHPVMNSTPPVVQRAERPVPTPHRGRDGGCEEIVATPGFAP
ncbi:hypothetical protein ASE95_00625 [Sphingomonas sp. Leaf231]|nr:hypothetical protein ASE95_00625 [Sphingomonas sp. Leaf231]